MNLLKPAFAFLLVLALITVTSDSAWSQCAMCKATIENNGGGYAAGLNRGILYLMSIPYLIFGVIGYFWYKQSRKKTQMDQYLAKKIQTSRR